MKRLKILNPNDDFWSLKLLPDKYIHAYSPELMELKIDFTLLDLLKSRNLDISECEKLFNDIMEIMEGVENNGYSIAYFNLKDIVVIDNSFYFVNDKKLFKIDKDDNIVVKRHFNTKLKFLPKEMSQERLSLPMVISAESYKYSLSLLCLFCMFKNYDIEKDLRILYGTTFFWTLNEIIY